MASTRRYRKLRRNRKHRKSQRRNKERKLSRKNNQIVGKKYVGGFVIASVLINLLLQAASNVAVQQTLGRWIRGRRVESLNEYSLLFFNYLSKRKTITEDSENLISRLTNTAIDDCRSLTSGNETIVQDCEKFKSWLYNAIANCMIYISNRSDKENNYIQDVLRRRDNHLSHIISQELIILITATTPEPRNNYWFKLSRINKLDEKIYNQVIFHGDELTNLEKSSDLTLEKYNSEVTDVILAISNILSHDPNTGRSGDSNMLTSDFGNIVKRDIYIKTFITMNLFFLSLLSKDEILDNKIELLRMLNTMVVPSKVTKQNISYCRNITDMYRNVFDNVKYIIPETLPVTSKPDPNETIKWFIEGTQISCQEQN